MPELILIYATPLFLILLLCEVIIDIKKGTGYYRLQDTFGSLSLGILSETSKLLKLGIGIWVLHVLLADFTLSIWPSVWWVWVVTFIAYDLTYYWSHRMGHTLNLFWAGHAVHHQSEEYNLSTALRQPSSSILTWIFLIPIVLLGAPLAMVLACSAWNLIYQFWVHTRHIDKMPDWYEWLMVTPSHHRVHHAQNAIYIDKNHGGVFIIWDRIFGTFQQELDAEPIIYGIRRPLQSFNPLVANFQVWMSLFKDAFHTRNWWDKLRLWFMPTGWRPQDVQQSHPILKSKLDDFKKHQPHVTTEIKLYSVCQIILCVLCGLYLILFNTAFDHTTLVLLWVLTSVPLVSVGMLLGGAKIHWEIARLGITWLLFLVFGSFLSILVWWLAIFTLCISSVCIGILLYQDQLPKITSADEY